MADTQIEADDGTRLFVRDSGAGRPVMLIAGLGGVGTFWDAIAERLSNNFRVVVPDHRGTGRSGRPEGGYEIDILAADMERIASRLGLGAFAIVGHSTGGLIAQRMLLRSKARVLGVVLSGTLAEPDAHFDLLFRTRLAVLEGAGPQVSAALAHLLGYPPEWVRDNIGAVDGAVARAATEDARISLARVRMLLDYRGGGNLTSIEVPVLVLGSEEDIIIPPYHQRALADAIPGAGLRMLPGGHFFPRVRPDAFAAEVASFLSTLA